MIAVSEKESDMIAHVCAGSFVFVYFIFLNVRIEVATF